MSVASLPFLTPLMRAAAIGHLEVVRQLLQEGADVNFRGPRGSTALMFAAGGGHLEIVQVLVENGADVLLKEDGGWTARMHAEGEAYDVASFLEGVEKQLGLKWGTA